MYSNAVIMLRNVSVRQIFLCLYMYQEQNMALSDHYVKLVFYYTNQSVQKGSQI